MNLRILVFVALILIAVSGFSAIEIKETSPTGLSIEFNTPPIRSVKLRDEEFIKLSMPGGGLGDDIGGPDLPVFRYLIELPNDGKTDIIVTSFSEREFRLTAPVYPRQPPRAKNQAKPEFAYNRSLYNKRSSERIAEIREIGILRGRRLGMLIIRPVAYDPINSMAIVREDISLDVKFSSPLEPTQKRFHGSWSPRLLSSSLLNPSDISHTADIPAHYLILTDHAFAVRLEEFIEYKEQQGYHVTVVAVDTIGTEPDEIKDFIYNAYHLWPSPPDYLLIVGDTDRVPAYDYDGRHPSDQYYVMVDGDDYLPDIACGRFSVETSDELEAIVNKTINHGRFDFSSTEWLRHIVLPACGTDGDYEIAMGTQRYIIASYIHAPDFEPDTVFAYHGATSDDLIDAINKGAAVVNYTGHGYSWGWNNPEMDTADIKTLTNSGKCPLVISNACLTNKFDADVPCFGEVWIREAEKGAVAHIGATNSTFWDEDDWWERAIYDAVFQDGYWSAATFIFKGNLEVLLHGSSEAEYYFQIYHVLGDPSLSVYWGEPEPITAVPPEILPAGISEIGIPAPDSTIVSVWMPSGPKGAAYSSEDVANITLSPIPIVEDTAIITYWLPNFYKPIGAEVPVMFMADVEVSPESLIIGVPDSLIITVRDTVNLPYSGVIVTLSGFSFCDTLTTDDSGKAVFHLTPQYAETLIIRGYRPGGGILFMKSVAVVGAMPFVPSVLNIASPLARVSDSLAIGFDGEIRIMSADTPYIYKLSGAGIEEICDTVITPDTVIIAVKPISDGTITLQTARVDRAIGKTYLHAALCRAPLEGIITDSSGSTAAVGVRISLYPLGADTSATAPIIEMTTDSNGAFYGGSAFQCAIYDMFISGYGWKNTHIEFVHHIEDNYHIKILQAERALLSGTIKDTSGAAVRAKIVLLHHDGRLLRHTNSDEFGNYSFTDLPYFNYSIGVFARDYEQYIEELTVDSSPLVQDVVLEYAAANVLLMDNGGGSATDSIESHLSDLGLTVRRIGYVPIVDSLFQYEFVIYSSGGREDSALYNSVHAERLLKAHRDGVKLLIEGGEVAWIYNNYAAQIFVDSLLMFDGWYGDRADSFSLIVEPAGAYALAHNPATLPHRVGVRIIDPYSEFYYFDKVNPGASDALYTIGGSPLSCVTYYADSMNDGVRRMAQFFFKYDDAFTTTQANKALLANIAEWLRPPDFDYGVLLAKVDVSGIGGEPSGITVTGGGDTTMTQPDGRFRLQVTPGTFDISFTASHIEDTVYRDYYLNAGEIRTGDIFVIEKLGNIAESYKPKEFELVIYPNPFNSAVIIALRGVGATERSHGQIAAEIFDITGRLVYAPSPSVPLPKGEGGKTLLPPGEGGSKSRMRAFIWQPDESIGSGIYLVRVKLGSNTIIRKVIYLK